MKTRTTPSMLIAILLAFLALGATNTQAFVVIGGRPVGIVFGQTARVTAANTGTTAIVIEGSKILDSDSNVLAEFARQVIDPGKITSFDLNADDIVRESNRIEIRGELTTDTSKGLVRSTEVFENNTGKTTVFWGDPED